MTHLPFVAAAFAVFVLVFIADALATHWRLRAARRDAQRRQQRRLARRQPTAASDLELGR